MKMVTEKVKRFQGMILAEYNRGVEAHPDFIPETSLCNMAKIELEKSALEAIGGDMEQACRGMIRAGALVLRFLADADPHLDGFPQKK